MKPKKPEGAHILEAARQYRGPWLILATLPIVYVWLIVFWDGRRASTAIWFSIGVLATAAFWSAQGWEPWNMAWIRRAGGWKRRNDDSIMIERTVSDFFCEPENKRSQFLWIAAGAALPWLIMGAGRLLNGRYIKTSPTVVPWWGMLILGVGEAVRGRATALFVLAGKLEANWPALLRSSHGEG